MTISLPDLFVRKQIVLELAAKTETDALREIANVLSAEEGLRDREKFIEELLAREKLQSTAAGNGIAFPHARTDSVAKIVLAAGRSRAGVPFGPSGELAHLIFVIGTPRRMVSDYLVCIGALARLLRNSDLREDLMRAETAAQFVEILKSATSAPA